MLVRWNKTNVMSVGTGIADGSGVQIIPGPNDIPKAQWDLIKDHPTIKERMELEIVDPVRGKVKMLEIVGAEKSEQKSAGNEGDDVSLTDLSAKDAKELVAETFNTELLRTWAESETRPGPAKAIEKQFEKIEEMRLADAESNNDSDDETIVE